jgi:PLD-like domain
MDDTLLYWKSNIGGTFSSGNRVTALVDGPTTFSAMYEAIQACIDEKDKSKARYIYLLGWWLDLDVPLLWKKGSAPTSELLALYPHGYEPVPGTTLGTLFTEAAASPAGGVQIRAMLWDQFFSPELYKEGKPPEKNSAEVKFINSLPHAAAILDDNTLSVVKPGLAGAHHQKLLLVRTGEQSLVAFCGGVDVNWDRVKAVNGQSPMHDVHCRIEGPAAKDLVGVFLQRWRGHPDHRNCDSEMGPLLAYKLQDSPPPVDAPSQQVRIVRTFNFISKDKVCAKEYSFRQAVTAAIRHSKRFIYIEDQYFVNFYDAAIFEEALKHVQFLFVLTSDSNLVDFPSVWYRRRSLIRTICGFSNGAEKLRVFIKARPGQKGVKYVEPYIHAKTWIIDDEVAIIGSSNFDRRGWGYQTEVGAIVIDEPRSVLKPSFAQRLRMKLWAEHLDLEEKEIRDATQSSLYWISPKELFKRNHGRRKQTASVASYDISGDGSDLGYEEYMERLAGKVGQIATFVPSGTFPTTRSALQVIGHPGVGYDSTDVVDPPGLLEKCGPDTDEVR